METKKNTEYDSLLTSLRILSCVDPGDFIGTDSNNNIYCRYSSNWWNTLTDLVRLETWECTHEVLKKIYCIELPEYINYVNLLQLGREHTLQDIKLVCKNALKGVHKLRDTYNIAYQTKSGGKYDEIFDTIINSYAKIHIKNIDDILNQKKDESFLAMPPLKRSVAKQF